jgi:hypothetical protein
MLDEMLLMLMLLALLAWLLVGPVVAMVRASQARSQAQRLREEVGRLKSQMDLLKQELRQPRPSAGPAMKEPEILIAAPLVPQPEIPPARVPAAAPEPPALPAMAEAAPQADWSPVPEPAPAVPPPIPRFSAATPPPPTPPAGPAEPPAAPFSLEHFMGVKLFAWLGGVALFFGIIFFVKYAFENNLIPPAVRVALGFVTGVGLLVGGLVLHRRAVYLVLAHAFCATGVLILYGVSFAAHAIYHFAVFNTGATFALMALITVAAFLIAVRLNALVVAVLGMLGGFITPVLLHTGHDQLLGLFGYIALLVSGLAAVSRHRDWGFLVPAAAVGTALMQFGWFAEYFAKERYDLGPKTLLPMGILLFFNALFMAVAWLEKRRGAPTWHSVGSALGMSGMAVLFAFGMLTFPLVAQRIPVLFGFLLLQNLAVLGALWLRPQWAAAQVVNGLLTFLLIAIWTGQFLEPANLMPALAVDLLFGALHAVGPVLLTRLAVMEGSPVPARLWPWAAPLTLLLLLLPIVNLPEPALVIWPAVLLVNLLAIGLAAATGAMLPVLGVLAVTLLLAIQWLFSVPARFESLSPFLGITLGFSAIFTLAGRWLAGRAGPPRESPADGLAAVERRVAAALPVLSGVLPFGLLLLAIERLPLADPSPVFGVALLLVMLLLGLAVIGCRAPRVGSLGDFETEAGSGQDARATGGAGTSPAAYGLDPSALVPAALAGLLAVQALWHSVAFNPETPAIPLAWNLGCYALFLAFPFAFRRTCESRIWPWITAAVAGIGYFLIVHNLVQRSFPAMADRMGLVPTAFAIPSLLALGVVVRMAAAMDPVNRSRLAWFGGVALFFITLIFPIQFDRQWLTVSWALEGALLLWLFRRVPHPGLQLTGLALLAVTFVRLALNPAVLFDYPRSGTPILNWHLYTYGIVATAQFLGARWFTDPGSRLQSINVRGILYALGGVLLFLLMNLEIADYFTAPGERVVSFGSGVNFQRDMTYSIAWGLFALGLLSLGIWHKARPARYAAIGLLVLTLVKVFLHDLSALASVFRIGALIGVAVIAFIASFLYQQFFNRTKNP